MKLCFPWERRWLGVPGKRGECVDLSLECRGIPTFPSCFAPDPQPDSLLTPRNPLRGWWELGLAPSRISRGKSFARLRALPKSEATAQKSDLVWGKWVVWGWFFFSQFFREMRERDEYLLINDLID